MEEASKSQVLPIKLSFLSCGCDVLVRKYSKDFHHKTFNGFDCLKNFIIQYFNFRQKKKR
jgi:hypothetical protein